VGSAQGRTENRDGEHPDRGAADDRDEQSKHDEHP
jgi:hypothetical protein